jgi:hypothetical protein
MAPYLYALIIFSIVIAAIAEILVSREKRQMKKQFLDELDKMDGTKGQDKTQEEPE